MKTAKIMLLILITITLTGCKDYGEKRIVRLLTADRDYITVYYYDYKQEKPAYLTQSTENTGIENAMVKLFAEHDYDLKLCSYAILSKELADNDLHSVFDALNKCKFSPDIMVVTADTSQNCEKYIDMDIKGYPLYSYNVSNGNITAVTEDADNGEKRVIVNSKLYALLDKQQGFVFDVLCKNKKKGTYQFADSTSEYSADLEHISSFYSVENNVLKINITAMMKSYKGYTSGQNNRKNFKEILEENIKQTAEDLLTDSIITQSFALDWYSKIETYTDTEINVNII